MLFWIHHWGEYQEVTTHDCFQVLRWFVPLVSFCLACLFALSCYTAPTVPWDVRAALWDPGCLRAKALVAAACLAPAPPLTFGSEVSVNCKEKEKDRKTCYGKRGIRDYEDVKKKMTYTFGFLNLPCPSSKILFNKSMPTGQWGSLQSCYDASESFFLLSVCLSWGVLSDCFLHHCISLFKLTL